MSPNHLGILLQGAVTRILTKCQCEVSVCRGQVPGQAVPGGIESSHGDHGFRIRLFRRRLHVAQAFLATLWHATTIKIFLSQRHGIVGSRGSRLRLFRLGRSRNIRCLGGWRRCRSCSCRCRRGRGVGRRLAGLRRVRIWIRSSCLRCTPTCWTLTPTRSRRI